ncbi:Ppx/GppA family phosphatase [Deinococcus detaillensis]|uniref:Ppx/GppA family phosphatase n=1 Tax=Deinococcus detaillensis TaxID=2592048 RepID=A0A553UQR6_9DEIO|nr:Ppx/GppA phosphatase family protein [Deinococcus detaillensis]TSA82556.1 Ppx/GppA family phosphatase [Deinococcus detaillensis]
MRVAVADIGTNSCHLLIAEARGSSYQVLDTLKERTRLGACLDEQRNITPEGERRLTEALKQFQELAHAAQVSEVRAYATSAMREAPNGKEVAARVSEASGVYPVMISGEREAQLTYLGAAHSVEFGADNLLLDLGGGSLELARGGPEQPDHVISLPLGSVRLHLTHLQKEPPGPRAVKALQQLVTKALEPHLSTFRVGSATRVFGSSGTFEAVGAAIAQRRGVLGVTEISVGGFSFEVSALSDLVRDLQKLTPAGRIRAGIDPRRADIIVAGAAILEAALRAVGAERATVSEGAMREGMVIEELAAQTHWESGLSARQRSAAALAERFMVSLPHARQVTALAQDLLSRLQRRGESFPEEAPSLLSAAAFLHEIGQSVSQSSHHKHSAYLIRHAGLRGFDPRQLELIAQIARYHRKSAPKSSHTEFQALSSVDREGVAKLTAILRVADGLDRTHSSQSQIVDLHREGGSWVLTVAGVTALDLAGAQDKSDVWRQVYGELKVEAAQGS